MTEKTFWWKEKIQNYEIRELTLLDIDQLAYLISSKPKFWKHASLTSMEIDKFVTIYEKKLQDPSRWKCFGAFFESKLVMETSACYPIKSNQWYSTSLRFNGNNESLFSGNLQRYLFAECFINLINHGENLNKFSFYSMRSIQHQKIINRMWDKAVYPSPLIKYDYYIDGIIPANTKNINYMYEIFFIDDKTYPIDLVVYLHCLKQSLRLEKLSLK